MAPGKLAVECRLSSAGTCTDGEVRIVDDEDRDAAVGTIGEFVVWLVLARGLGGHPQRLKTPCITPIVWSAYA
jgi:hypothetical protein